MSDEEYQERLHHQRIHHEAKIRLIEAEHDAVLEKLSTLVTIAQAGLAKNKPHVTEYQLDRMCDLLGDSNVRAFVVEHERKHREIRESNIAADYVINSALEESSNA
jgi:hypothetical protein